MNKKGFALLNIAIILFGTALIIHLFRYHPDPPQESNEVDYSAMYRNSATSPTKEITWKQIEQMCETKKREAYKIPNWEL